MKILIHFGFDESQIEELRELADRCGSHQVLLASAEEEALLIAADIEVILGHFPEPVTQAASSLRWIQSFSAGMDKLLYPSIIERDEVTISNMAGLYAPQGGEHAWALLLALARGMLPSIRNMTPREWKGGVSTEITGTTLGILGLGGFGQETAQRAAGFDMRLIGLDPIRLEPENGFSEVRTPTKENLHWMLSESDSVVVACPLTAETHHMIGAEELAQMKSSAYLICTSRGGIIEENALAEALQNGTIAGSGIDVTEVEPLPEESPLWDAPNLILTPHRAGSSQHRPRKTFEFFRDQLERYLTGETPRNIIDKRRGY